MSLRIYLDDCRPAPDGWTLARTAEEAIALLSTGTVTVLSLDHDLALENYASDDAEGNYDACIGYSVVLSLDPVCLLGIDRVELVASERFGTAHRSFSREVAVSNGIILGRRIPALGTLVPPNRQIGVPAFHEMLFCPEYFAC